MAVRRPARETPRAGPRAVEAPGSPGAVRRTYCRLRTRLGSRTSCGALPRARGARLGRTAPRASEATWSTACPLAQGPFGSGRERLQQWLERLRDLQADSADVGIPFR